MERDQDGDPVQEQDAAWVADVEWAGGVWAEEIAQAPGLVDSVSARIVDTGLLTLWDNPVIK